MCLCPLLQQDLFSLGRLEPGGHGRQRVGTGQLGSILAVVEEESRRRWEWSAWARGRQAGTRGGRCAPPDQHTADLARLLRHLKAAELSQRDGEENAFR